MSNLERNDSERVPRQKVAERLTDLAYSLAAGGPLELSVDGERLSIPLADDVLLERDLKAGTDCVKLELSLSWSNEGDDSSARPGTHTTRLKGAPPMSIADEVRAALASDPRIHHPAEVSVVERAGTVTLRGTVRSLHQRRTAVEIAGSVSGAARVDDQLRIDPRDHYQDDEIRGAALQALASDDAVPADRVDVSVSSGWLTLTGVVKRQSDSDAAFASVSHLAGVGGITNAIKVITAGADG